jgi:hypothetical protein
MLASQNEKENYRKDGTKGKSFLYNLVHMSCAMNARDQVYEVGPTRRTTYRCYLIIKEETHSLSCPYK